MNAICKDSPMISVIVPVYKAEKYLNECIESVLNQTYFDFELILVDDGSPDGCPAICDLYAEKDARVKVIHKQNGGVSRARNTGMENARGEFVMFLDSDDFIEPATLMAMMSKMDDSIDCVLCGLYYFYPDEKKNFTYRLPDVTMQMPEEFDKYFQSIKRAGGNFTSCAKLFRHSIIIANKLSFEEEYALLEDASFASGFLRYCRKCHLMSDAFYHYRQLEEESLVKRFHANADKALAMFYTKSLWMKDHLSFENWQIIKEVIDDYQAQFITQIYDCSQLGMREKLSALKRFSKTFRENQFCRNMKKKPFTSLICCICLNCHADRLLHWFMLIRVALKRNTLVASLLAKKKG